MQVKQSGFTLLELMVTIVIVGILAGIAIPSTVSYLASTRRQDGFSDLYTIMAQQERYFLNNVSYTLTLGNGGLGYQVNGNDEVTSPKEYYLISAALCRDDNDNPFPNVNNCIRLVATARNSLTSNFSGEDGAGRDPGYWLQSDGQKSPLMP